MAASHCSRLLQRSLSCSVTPAFAASGCVLFFVAGFSHFKSADVKIKPLSGQRVAARATHQSVMASSPYGPPAMRTIVREASPGKHSATVVWLHGLGDTGAGWADAVEMVGLPHIKWVLPSAPVMPVSVNGGYPCPSWFDILGLTPDSPDDKKGIDLAARHIASILQQEHKEGIRLAIGGFSQGGALSLYLTMRKALGTFLDGSDASSVPLVASVALSSWLPVSTELKALSSSETSKEVAGKHPVLMCHGTSDMIVQFGFGKSSAEALESAGFSNLTFSSYRGMSHEASPKELADLRSWLEKHLPHP